MNFFDKSRAKNLILSMGILFLAIFSGLVATQGPSLLVLILIGLILSPLVILVSTEQMLVGALAIGFVFTGVIMYFGRVAQMHWLVALLFLAMVARFPFELFGRGLDKRQKGTSLVSVCLVYFCGMAIFSIFLNVSPALQAVVGLKHYLFPLALTALIAFGRFTPKFLLSVWRWIPILVIVQLPVSLYQYFFIAKSNTHSMAAQGISWDSIVGTFGGNPEGGGASGALAWFLCFGVIATVSLREHKLISRSFAWCAYLCGALVIILAEVKVVIIFLPIGFLAFKRREVFRSLPTALTWFAATALFVPGLLLLYSLVHWGDAGLHFNSLGDIFEYSFKAESDVNFRSRLTGELSRSAALNMWWTENILTGDFLHALFGHGPAASKVSATFGYGEAAKRYIPYQLTTSALSAMLWDLGLIGTFALIGALLFAASTAFSKVKEYQKSTPILSSIYDVCGVGALLLIVDMPYNLDIISNSAIQMTMATILGMVITEIKFESHMQHSSNAQMNKKVVSSYDN
jgi:hypothetical protein